MQGPEGLKDNKSNQSKKFPGISISGSSSQAGASAGGGGFGGFGGSQSQAQAQSFNVNIGECFALLKILQDLELKLKFQEGEVLDLVLD